MRILLIAPPKEREFALFVLEDYSTKARSNQHPLGLLYLQSYLSPFHSVEIFDMNALELSISDIKAKIDEYKPDIIGISTVIAKWETVRELSRVIKEHAATEIVLGGVNPSLYPWETLQWPYIDYVIAGFGQIPLKSLCDAIENNLSTDNIENCFTRNNCKEKITGKFDFVDLDEFPMPDRSILPINDYVMPIFPENPTTSMVTSVGCPFKCGFCACKNFKPLRIRKVENIIAEMKHIESIGIRSILFNDELFTMNTKRITEICSGIISEKINLNWSVRSRANLVNIEALKLMKQAGCVNIHLGIESGTDRILTEMNKQLDIETIRKSVQVIKEAGLSVTASFMIGYPDETKAEIMATIFFAKQLELNSSQFFITQPESRTELYQKVRPCKGLPDDIYSEFTLDPANTDLKNNIASMLFSKAELENFLKLAYSQTKNLYSIKNA